MIVPKDFKFDDKIITILILILRILVLKRGFSILTSNEGELKKKETTLGIRSKRNRHVIPNTIINEVFQTPSIICSLRLL